MTAAIFEAGTEEVQSAFKFAMTRHAKNSTLIMDRKFDIQVKFDVINTADAFKLSRLICNRFASTVYSMIGAVNPDSFDILHSYSNTFQMPFVTPWFPEKVLAPSSGTADFAISVWPDYHQAIIDTIRHYGWRKIIYLYDSHDGNLLIIDSGFHEGWSTPMIPKLQHEDSIRVTTQQGVWIVNLMYVGVGIGSLIPLLLMDRVGRKWTMFIAAIPKISSWIIFACARDYQAFYVGRFLAGIGTGITYCVTPMYLGEISTKQTRGPLSASLAVWINIGLLMIYAIGLWSSRLTMSLVAVMIPMMFLMSFMWLPKSAVFLAKKNRMGKAEKVLKWSLGRDNVDAELEEIKRIVASEKTNCEKVSVWESTLDSLTKVESRKAFNIVAILLSAMIFSGAAPILAYQVDTFEEAGFEISTEVSVLASGLTIVVSGIACVVLVKHTGKRMLLLVAAPVTVVSHGVVAAFFTLKAAGADVSDFKWVPTVFIMIYALFYGVALNPLPLSYISEVFPVDVKVPAAIFTSVFYAVGSVFVVDMYQALRQEYGTYLPFWCFSAISSFLWLLIYLFVPETEGRSLEEIQMELRGGRADGKAPPPEKSAVMMPFLVSEKKELEKKSAAQQQATTIRLLRLQQIYQGLRPGKDTFQVETVKRIQNATEAMDFLRSIEELNRLANKYVVLDCPTKMAKEIIVSHVRDVTLGRRTYHYLLSGLIMDERWESEVIEYGAINITGFRIVDTSRPQVKEFLEAWRRLKPDDYPGAGRDSISAQAALMYDAAEVLLEGFNSFVNNKSNQRRKTNEKANQRRVEKGGGSQGASSGFGFQADPVSCHSNQTWISVFKHGEKISQSLRGVKVEGLTGLIEFNSEGRRQNLTLDVVEMTVNSAPVKVAEWTNLAGYQLVPTKRERHQRAEILKNKTYIVTTILEAPFIMRKDFDNERYPDQIKDRFEGYCRDLAELICHKLNISWELQIVRDNQYGVESHTSPGGWNGMVGELVRNEADIAIGPLTITSERERVVDFSKPFMPAGISIMIRKPNKTNPGVFSFLNPLSKEIWVCVVFSCFAVAIVLFIVSRFSPYEWRVLTLGSSRETGLVSRDGTLHGPPGMPHQHTTMVNDFSILNSLWFALGAIMQQGSDISPRSISGRIVGSVWWFFTLILISSYTANLAAFLTIERMVTPINSVEDLAAQSDVYYGTIANGSTWDFFRRSQMDIYKQMWRFMNENPQVFVKSYEDGIRRVRDSKGKYALLIESPKNDYANEHTPCDTMKIGRNLDAKGYGIATPLGSPLRDSINAAVNSLKDSGELAKLKNKWWYERTECRHADKQDTSRHELSLSNVAGIFYILIAGLLVALAVALIEFCYKSHAEASRAKIPLSDAMKAKARLTIGGGRDFDNGRWYGLQS